MTAIKNTLLKVGASEWAAINREEAMQRIGWARERTVEELVQAGIALSWTAHQVLEAVGGPGSRDARTS